MHKATLSGVTLLVLMGAMSATAGTPTRPVPVIEPPNTPVRCHAVEIGAPLKVMSIRSDNLPSCLIEPPQDLGTLIGYPDGLVVWETPDGKQRVIHPATQPRILKIAVRKGGGVAADRQP